MHVGQLPFRLIRAVSFAAACVAVSAGMHLFAGGAGIATPTLLVAVALTALAAFAAAGRQRGMAVLLSACLIAQFALHHLFSLGAASHAHHVHMEHPLAMPVLHALAAVASATWLERGESALGTLLDLWCAAMADVLAPPRGFAHPPPPRRTIAAVSRRRPPRSGSVRLTSVMSRRGPPAFAVPIR